MAEIERDNYYILLGLDPDAPAAEPGKIKSALRAKKQEWTRWQDNPGKRNLGLNYLGQAQDIEKVMLDHALREKEAARAREIRSDMLAQFEAELRVLESKGHILPREASAIAVKYRAYGVTSDTVAKYAKCPISDQPQRKEEDEGEALDRVTAKNIQRNLQLLGFPTLYAFLGEPPYSSVKKLLAAAEQKRRAAAAQGTKSSQATISQELAGICASLFESIVSKQKYDRYLKVGRYPAVNDLLDEEFARSQYIAPDVLLRIVNFMVEKYAVKILEAEEYIKSYCNAYDIPLDSRGASTVCPACHNKTPRGGTVCTVCAQPLAGTCPVCGDAFENGSAVCGACGFSISTMHKALGNLGEAETALIENNWSTAQRNLQYVKKYWPGHPKLELLEKRAALLEERYATYIDSVEDCIKHRQLYAAKELVDEAEARHLRLPAALVRNLASQLAAFEYRVEKALSREGDPDLDKLLVLSSEVTDSLELTRLLNSYPPEPPPDLIAEVSGKQVCLSWGLTHHPCAVSHCVVRKRGGAPLTALDGETVYEGPANSFTDTTADPLLYYYYSVFTRRAGTYSSSGATCGPVIVVPEIEGLRIFPVDGGAQLTWNFNPDVREVMISRKLGGDAPTHQGDGILLENGRLDGFSDAKLKNEVVYWYYLSAAYIVEGARVVSKGVCDSVIPRKTVAPIEELNIAPTDGEGGYIASWDSAQHSDVLLFCSAKKPDFRAGDIFAVEDMLTKYRKLDLDYKRIDSAQFKLGISGGVYLFAARVFGRFATVCEPRYVVNVADVDEPTCDIIGGDLYLNMKWPVGVTDVSVAYRFDRYPKSPEEHGVTVYNCTRAQYDSDAAIVLRDPEPNIYYMTIFAAVASPDGKKAYSSGVELTVNNQPQQELFYSFDHKKKRFSDNGTLNVALSSSEDFVLPKAVVVGKIGRLPLGRSDGLPLFELEKEMRVSGSVMLQFATAALPPNIYVRLFLHDDALYEKFRLIPASKMKIT